MNDSLMLLLVILAVAVAAGSWIWHLSRSRTLLDQWAAANGFQIVSAEYRNLLRGPFFWGSSKGQTVYRITVRDHYGAVRSGWLRCGSYWGGLMSDKTEVRWD